MTEYGDHRSTTDNEGVVGRPLCDEPTFARILTEIVADEALRIFAIVQEYGQRADARVAAWGMAFTDHAELVSVDRTVRMVLGDPTAALRAFRWPERDIDARLVWYDATRATGTEEDDPADCLDG